MQPNSPPAPPTIPLPPTPASQVQIVAPVAGVSPANVYRASREQRSELQDQLRSLERKRDDLQEQLQQDATQESRSGIVARIREIDGRISQTDAQLAAANAAVANAAAVPGAVVKEPPPRRSGPPDGVFIIGSLFIVVTLLPISLAYARRIWRRGKTIIAPVPQEVRDQISRLAEAVETIGIEVERIGEGQRFITNVFAQQKSTALGAGAAAELATPRQRDIERSRAAEITPVR